MGILHCWVRQQVAHVPALDTAKIPAVDIFAGDQVTVTLWTFLEIHHDLPFVTDPFPLDPFLTVAGRPRFGLNH